MDRINSTRRASGAKGLLATVVVLAFVAPASAQIAGWLENTDMTPEDIKLAETTAHNLYARSGVRAGQKASWKNDISGAHGTTEIMKVDNGGACVTFRQSTKPKSQPLRFYVMRRCRNAEGVWVMAP